jgi:hypothetical protein
MVKKAHNCEDFLEEHAATLEQQYHYVGSGLSNVFLTGINYFVCSVCRKEVADIPAIKELLTAIARTIVEKHSPLIGPEVRFLRKRLQKKGVEFAPMISVTPEHLSRMEGQDRPLGDLGRDKLIRLLYKGLSGDKALQKVYSTEKKFEEWITAISDATGSERIIANYKRKSREQWHVETQIQAA